MVKSGFPGGSDGKASACKCRRPGFNPWVRKIPWRRKWHPTQVFLPGKSHGQRSLVGYSPWGRKESDTTERLHFTSGHNMCSLAVESRYVTTTLKNDFCSAPWSPVATLIHLHPFPSMTTPHSRRGSFNSAVSSSLHQCGFSSFVWLYILTLQWSHS